MLPGRQRYDCPLPWRTVSSEFVHQIAKFYLPGPDEYALLITSNGREEVLYEEAMVPGKKYVYRPDPTQSEGRYFVLTEN